jgi:hypothetical protein
MWGKILKAVQYLGFRVGVWIVKVIPTPASLSTDNERLSTGVVNKWIRGKTREMDVYGWPISLVLQGCSVLHNPGIIQDVVQVHTVVE